MNIWKAFPLLQVTANPLSANEQTGLATVCKPIKNQQELVRHAGSNHYLGPNAAGKSILPGKGLHNSLRVPRPCACVTFGNSLPVYCLNDLFLRLTRDHCIVFRLSRICAVRGETRGIGTFSTGVQLIHLTYCFVIQYWWLSSGAHQKHDAYSAGHCNNIHPERLGEDYNPSAFFAVHNLMNP